MHRLCGFCSSSSIFDGVEELPKFELLLHLNPMPIPMAEALDGRDQSQREEKFVELLAKAKAGRSGEPALDSTVDDLVF